MGLCCTSIVLLFERPRLSLDPGAPQPTKMHQHSQYCNRPSLRGIHYQFPDIQVRKTSLYSWSTLCGLQLQWCGESGAGSGQHRPASGPAATIQLCARQLLHIIRLL